MLQYRVAFYPVTVSATQFRLLVRNTSGNYYYTSTFGSWDTWYHIAGVFRDNGNITVYKNGTLFETYGPSGPLSSTYLAIGAYSSNLKWNYQYKGLLGEFSLWDRELTAEEISQRYQGSMIADQTGIIGWYKMEEQQGESLIDSSSQHYDLPQQNPNAKIIWRLPKSFPKIEYSSTVPEPWIDLRPWLAVGNDDDLKIRLPLGDGVGNYEVVGQNWYVNDDGIYRGYSETNPLGSESRPCNDGLTVLLEVNPTPTPRGYTQLYWNNTNTWYFGFAQRPGGVFPYYCPYIRINTFSTDINLLKQKLMSKMLVVWTRGSNVKAYCQFPGEIGWQSMGSYNTTQSPDISSFIPLFNPGPNGFIRRLRVWDRPLTDDEIAKIPGDVIPIENGEDIQDGLVFWIEADALDGTTLRNKVQAYSQIYATESSLRIKPGGFSGNVIQSNQMINFLNFSALAPAISDKWTVFMIYDAINSKPSFDSLLYLVYNLPYLLRFSPYSTYFRYQVYPFDLQSLRRPDYSAPVMQGVVADSDNIKCYFNRFPIFNANTTTAFGTSLTLRLFNTPARPFGIEAVRIYNRVLSSEEIGKLIDWYKQKARENFPRIIGAP